jgi:hypothetical protein
MTTLPEKEVWFYIALDLEIQSRLVHLKTLVCSDSTITAYKFVGRIKLHSSEV